MRILDDLTPNSFLLDDDDLSCELFEENEAVSLEDLLQLVQENNENGDADLRAGHFACDEDALVWGLSALCETKLGRDLAFDARFEDWSIEVDDIESNLHIIDPQLRILILPRFSVSPAQLSKSPVERAKFILELARGLRGIWHEMTGVRENKDLIADDQILWERMRRMDHDLCAFRMAWDLRAEGLGGLWRQIIASDHGDFAVICSEIWEQEQDLGEPLPLFGFSQLVSHWLKDEKLLSIVDSHTLDVMDMRLQRSAKDVCGSTQIDPAQLMTLSSLPAEGSYLAPLARTLLYVPEFRALPDPVNEAHLRQILEECDFVRLSKLTFSDSELERKLFPNRINTLA